MREKELHLCSFDNLTLLRINRKYGIMKTTLIMSDELVRRAKARAALRGQPLSRYVEESLERALKEDEASSSNVSDWLDSLPSISKQASRDLNKVIGSNDFRSIDPDMWK